MSKYLQCNHKDPQCCDPLTEWTQNKDPEMNCWMTCSFHMSHPPPISEMFKLKNMLTTPPISAVTTHHQLPNTWYRRRISRPHTIPMTITPKRCHHPPKDWWGSSIYLRVHDHHSTRVSIKRKEWRIHHYHSFLVLFRLNNICIETNPGHEPLQLDNVHNSMRYYYY